MDNSSIIFNVPRKLENNLRTLEFLIELHDNFQNFKNRNIYISFTNTKWIEPNLLAVLGSIFSLAKQQGNKIILSNINAPIRSLFEKYHFAGKQKLDISSDNITPNNYIPYNSFDLDNIEKFEEYLEEQLTEIISYHAIKRLINRLKEIYVNVETHAITNDSKIIRKVFCSGYYNRGCDWIIFTITNFGKTFNEVISNICVFENEYDSIEWALKKGNSTKKGIPGGIGLHMFETYTKEKEGHFSILSGKGYYDTRENKKIDLEKSYRGTIITIEIPIKTMQGDLCELTEVNFFEKYCFDLNSFMEE